MFDPCREDVTAEGVAGAAPVASRGPNQRGQVVARSPAGDPPSLRIHVDFTTGRLTAVGRLERRTTYLLADAVRTLLLAGHRQWHLDLDQVTAIDSAGVRAVVAAYRRALRHDRELIVHGPTPDLRQAMRRLRLDTHLLAPQALTGMSA